VFDEDEAPILLAVPQVYDVPIFKQVKVHRDFHAEVARALYSIPGQWIGSVLEARADSALVKFYARGNLVKVHPRQPAGGRSTDPEDLPTEKVGYAMEGPGSADRHLRRARPLRRDLRRKAARRSVALDLRCGRSTGCSGWSAATGPARSKRRAARRWIWTWCR
jgi:hypothetical protein